MDEALNDMQILIGLVLVAVLSIAGGRARLVTLQRRFGLEHLLASNFPYLLLGLLLSDAGLGLLDWRVVRELEALTTLGLGMLGLMVGLNAGANARPSDRHHFRAATIETTITILLVAPAMFLALSFTGATVWERASAAALVGCAAALSGRGALEAAARSRRRPMDSAVAKVADFGTVVAVLLAGVLIALFVPDDTMSGLERLLLLAAVSCVGGLAAWLLSTSDDSPSLKTALLLGTILVTAGTATHLGLPPVAATLLAGLLIARLPGPLATDLRTNLAFLEGPLTVLVVLLAGAALRPPSAVTLAVVAVALLLRTAGKIIGGQVASRRHPELPSNIGLGLLPAGAIGVGLAFDFGAATEGQLGEIVVTTTVLVALLSETAGVWTGRLLSRTVGMETDPLQPPQTTTPPPTARAEEAPR